MNQTIYVMMQGPSELGISADATLHDWDRTEDLSSITVPTLALCGSNDIRGEMLEVQKEFFNGPYEWTLVEGCGHFLHRERPAEVTRLVTEWLQRSK